MVALNHNRDPFQTLFKNQPSVEHPILSNRTAPLEQIRSSTKEYFNLHPIDKIYPIHQHSIEKIVKIDGIDPRYYAIYNQQLGKGSYSQVYLGQDIDTLELLAVKIQPYLEPGDIEHEVKQLAILNDFRGDISTHEQPQKMHYLFSKYFAGITVEQLYSADLKLKEQEILDIIRSSFYALKDIHDRNVVHNDVHEGNLIFNPTDQKSHWVDMAFSLHLNPGVSAFKIKTHPLESPPNHKAPESNTERSYATDVYQLGFMSLRLMLILSERDMALKNKYRDSRELCYETLQKNTPSITSGTPEARVYRLLFKMMAPDAHQRPTLKAALEELELSLSQHAKG